ncbi:MAG: hypothetical protein MHPSP_004644, partial [Paramarteilia canceri]
ELDNSREEARKRTLIASSYNTSGDCQALAAGLLVPTVTAYRWVSLNDLADK